MITSNSLYNNKSKKSIRLPEGQLRCAEGTLHWRSHFICRRQPRFVSASGMKLSYAQMKLSAKADKRSCVLADTNTKNKSKSFDLLYFLALLPKSEP